MRLVWVTGIAGAGKSTICQVLKFSGIAAINTDWDGLNHWVHRVTGEPVVDPPDPTPADWLDTYEWHIRSDRVRTLRDSGPGVTLLFGAVANECEVWDLFDSVGCLVVDDETIRARLSTRTTNSARRSSTAPARRRGRGRGTHPRQRLVDLRRQPRCSPRSRRLV